MLAMMPAAHQYLLRVRPAMYVKMPKATIGNTPAGPAKCPWKTMLAASNSNLRARGLHGSQYTGKKHARKTTENQYDRKIIGFCPNNPLRSWRRHNKNDSGETSRADSTDLNWRFGKNRQDAAAQLRQLQHSRV